MYGISELPGWARTSPWACGGVCAQQECPRSSRGRVAVASLPALPEPLDLRCSAQAWRVDSGHFSALH